MRIKIEIFDANGAFKTAIATVPAHGHTGSSDGGTLSAAAIASGQIALARGGTGADLSATGGSNQFVKQSSAAANLSVGTIASADIATALATPGNIGGTTPAAVTATVLTADSFKFSAPNTATLSSDAFSWSQGYTIVAAETGTADNLVTINNGSQGRCLIIQADAGDTITVKRTGNIVLSNGNDYILTGDTALILIYEGSAWVDLTLDSTSPEAPQGRLTLTTATAITTANVTAAGTLYYTPYRGNKLWLFDGTRWKRYTFTELSLSLTLTSGKNYDVFVYDNSGTLTLELSAAWTNDTTRADALTTQDAFQVKSGATTRFWLGTIRASGTNTTEDSDSKRFVQNYYNRVPFEDIKFDTTNSWTDAGNGTWSAIDGGNAAWTHEFVIGLDEYKMEAEAHLHAAVLYIFAIAIDSSTSLDRTKTTVCMLNDVSAATPMIATWCAHSGIGYHYLQGIETTYNASAATAYGDNGGSIGSSGQGFMNSGFKVRGWR